MIRPTLRSTYGAGSALALLALIVSACAADPFKQRREEPRLGAAGWVVAVPLEQPPEVASESGARAAAEALDAKIAPDCAEPRASTLAGVERLAASDAALKEIAGDAHDLVRQRVVVTACGETRTHVVYPARDAAGDPVFLTGTPGASIASLELQRQVVTDVITQAVGIMASGQPVGACDAMATEPWVIDTALAARPRRGQWSEDWTVAACGARRTITIDFEETPTGTHFSAPISLGEDE